MSSNNEKMKILLDRLENRTLEKEEITSELKPLLRQRIQRLHMMGDHKCKDDLEQFVFMLDDYIS